MKNKFIHIIGFGLMSCYLNATPFTLNSNGISHVYPPIDDDMSRWYNVSGSPFHHGSDTYADDWNLRNGYTAGIEPSTSCDRDKGAIVISSFAGEVIHADINGDIGSYGKEVIIRSSDNPSFAMRYSHLDTVSVTNGHVNVGTPLGTVGDTGTDCAHLHLVLYKNLNATAIARLEQGNSARSLNGVADTFAAPFYIDATSESNENNQNNISRSTALELILNKFEISTRNAGFNSSRFGQTITLPSDVSRGTSNYDAIVVGYNRGIITGDNGQFYPERFVSFQEFITMIVRTIPIPLDNPQYRDYNHISDNSAFYKYIKAAYNADIIENKSYNFELGLDENIAEELLLKAFSYFRGNDSGISIYLKWDREYVDLDMYSFSPSDSGNIVIEKNDDGYITNMGELDSHSNLLYWNRHSTNWGSNLDYDSWGGNGGQAWTGFGEERATVDSLMVKRPGTYSFIICYYDWNSHLNVDRASYDMIGYQGAKNITSGGVLKGEIDKGKCKVGGTLTTK